MALTSIGDLTQHFLGRAHNVSLRTRMTSLTKELTTGQVADQVKHLSGDTARLATLDRGLSMASAYGNAAKELGHSLGSMQIVLDRFDSGRDLLMTQLLTVGSGSAPSQMDAAADAASAGFIDAVNTLNTQIAGKAMFAGTADGSAALADPQAMLADIAATVAGAPNAAAVSNAIDIWFDDPTGGFATVGYLGDSGAYARRPVGLSEAIGIEARADDAELKLVLKAAAKAAMSGAMGPLSDGSERAVLVQVAGNELLTAGSEVAAVQARIGMGEARAEMARANHSAQHTAWSFARNDLVGADPFETASALQETQLQLETHYTLTARLARLTMTEYLR